MSLYILDTDILSLLQHSHPTVEKHVRSVPPGEIAVTIITVEEQLTGWMGKLRKSRQVKDTAEIYQRFTATVGFLSGLPLHSFTEDAIHRHGSLLALKLNIGKMDLRIAAIALEAGATLVTRNLRDFRRVPNLMVADWSV